MDYEKLYKEALERAKDVYTYYCDDREQLRKIESIFPELAKSEDERIRKELAEFLKQASGGFLNTTIKCKTFGKWLSWLEKQESVGEIVARCKDSWYNEGKVAGMAEGLTDDEKYQQGWHDALEKQDKHLENYDEYERGRADVIEDTCNWLSQQGDILEDCFSDVNDFVDLYKKAVGGGEKPQGKTAIEAVKEEKANNANKVKPKFHEGEWIVWENQYYKVNYNGCGYELVDQNDLNTSLEYGTIDESAHLWDITKDAKNGDVLVSGEIIFIFNKIHDAWINCHCSTHKDGSFMEEDYDLMTIKYGKEVFPATKKQRDLLFQKMKKAGYEWDADKKELKEIRQKPTIDYIDSLIDSHPKDNWELVHEFVKKFGRIPEDEDELNVLVEYVLKRQKPTEWSDEDEEKFRDVIRLIEQGAPVQSIREHYTNWLKSIKDKVQPQPKQEWSEEDDYNLQCMIAKVTSDIQNGNIGRNQELIDWLKSFKDRVQPQKQWKPSDEQIKTCKEVYADILSAKGFDLGTVNNELNRLEEQLKKLKE